jgi:hypothetical protein
MERDLLELPWAVRWAWQMESGQTYFYNGGNLAVTLVSNQVQAETASAARPSFSFRTANDTGFYWIGANTVGYSAGGTLRTQFSNGDISNSGTTRSSNFLGTATASNQIGGVTFSNLGSLHVCDR